MTWQMAISALGEFCHHILGNEAMGLDNHLLPQPAHQELWC